MEKLSEAGQEITAEMMADIRPLLMGQVSSSLI